VKTCFGEHTSAAWQAATAASAPGADAGHFHPAATSVTVHLRSAFPFGLLLASTTSSFLYRTGTSVRLEPVSDERSELWWKREASALVASRISAASSEAIILGRRLRPRPPLACPGLTGRG